MTHPIIMGYDPVAFHMLPDSITEEQEEQYPHVVELSASIYFSVLADDALPECLVHAVVNTSESFETFMGYRLQVLQEVVHVRFEHACDAVLFKLIWGGAE